MTEEILKNIEQIFTGAMFIFFFLLIAGSSLFIGLYSVKQVAIETPGRKIEPDIKIRFSDIFCSITVVLMSLIIPLAFVFMITLEDLKTPNIRYNETTITQVGLCIQIALIIGFAFASQIAERLSESIIFTALVIASEITAVICLVLFLPKTLALYIFISTLPEVFSFIFEYLYIYFAVTIPLKLHLAFFIFISVSVFVALVLSASQIKQRKKHKEKLKQISQMHQRFPLRPNQPEINPGKVLDSHTKATIAKNFEKNLSAKVRGEIQVTQAKYVSDQVEIHLEECFRDEKMKTELLDALIKAAYESGMDIGEGFHEFIEELSERYDELLEKAIRRAKQKY